ncbi:uncharacterized protein PG998_014077 [Apiospora kogelbergensis]|uniref:Uncharacterized protein n=1 Tax=Apiospora kogelbergensis TaxID=1337665 RepID=A0AAW0QYS0_9PEZI
MSFSRYSLRPTARRVAATRAANELGTPASEARHVVRSASGQQRQRERPCRIRVVGYWSPENRAARIEELHQPEAAVNYRLIIQTRALENPDRPRVQVIRPPAAAPPPDVVVKQEQQDLQQDLQQQQQPQQQQQQLPQLPDQEQVQDIQQLEQHHFRCQRHLYSIRYRPHLRLHSIHDNQKGQYVYHQQRDAHRTIYSTWLGPHCISLYDFDLTGCIWESPGVFDFIRRVKDTTDLPLILQGLIDGQHVSTYDCRTRQHTWKAAGFD